MKGKIIFILIILLTIALRFYQLGINPPGLDWDEASLGYNAYSILKTGKDEYGNFLPLSIRSFNDYKPPLYSYLSIIPVSYLGLNEFSTRFISAFFGTLTVVVTYFLIKELFPYKSSLFFILAALFLAISPWHIQFSRTAFEANLGLFFFISGIWLFLKALNKPGYFLASFFSFALSVFSYHSPRLLVPMMITVLFTVYFKKIIKKKKWFFGGLIIFIFLSLPVYIFLFSSTTARLGSVTVINQNEKLGNSIRYLDYDKNRSDLLGSILHNRRIIYAREILGGYLDHFNFDFLFLTGDAAGRHHAVSMGNLYLWDFIFILAGIYYFIHHTRFRQNKILLVLWFLVAPFASALTKATPHAVRSLYYLPLYQILISLGVWNFAEYLKNRFMKIKRLIILSAVFLLLILNFYFYLDLYWVHTPVEQSQWWQYGYKELVDYTAKVETNYNKILVTYEYDQPYIFFLFYRKVDPAWYQANWGSGEIERSVRKFGKYEFRDIDFEKDRQRENTLIIGSPKEIPADAAGLIKEIYFLDGSVAFRIVSS